MAVTSHICRVKVTLDFLGILPVGGLHSTPEEAAKKLFRMTEVGLNGFVLEKRDIQVTSKEVELPDAP